MSTYYYNADRRNELGMDMLCYAISGRNGKSLCNQNLRVLFEGLPKKFWFLLDTRCVSAIDIDHAQTVGACISAWLMYGRSGPQKELSMIFPIDGHGDPFFTGPFNEWLRSLMRGLGSQLKHDLYAGGSQMTAGRLSITSHMPLLGKITKRTMNLGMSIGRLKGCAPSSLSRIRTTS